MIISHKYKFIFIKTGKTAGTSIEVYLSDFCGDDDIVTPINPHLEPHVARNYKGIFNPFKEIVANRGWGAKGALADFYRRNKFTSHLAARKIKQRIPKDIFNSYYKFCVERNPWDRTMSHYHMVNARSGGRISLGDYFQRGKFCDNYPIYTDINGNVIVNEILRYENLNVELSRVFGALGVPFGGELNVKAKSEYRRQSTRENLQFSDAQKELISRLFRRDIELMGY